MSDFWKDIIDEEDVEEIEDNIRTQVKVVIRTAEIFWEELQKSSLPENAKMQLLLNGTKKENK